MCIECEPELLLQRDGCIPKFDDCVIPLSQQPERLSVDAHGNYYCGECMPGEFLDEELLRCFPCSDLDEDCMRCKNADECDYCANGLKPHGPECETPTIAFCKHVDPADYDKCLECSRGYSLTHDNSTCVNCRTLAGGCNSCDVDPFGRPTECTDCIGRLGGPECTWDTCEEWTTFRHGIHFREAQCVECVDGYSRTPDGGCAKCDDGYGYWTSCTSCAVDEAHKPTEC